MFNSDCNNSLGICDTEYGPNPSYWVCACNYGIFPCARNEDCCSNKCSGSRCDPYGKLGSVCEIDNNKLACGFPYVCRPWSSQPNFGYCDTVNDSK